MARYFNYFPKTFYSKEVKNQSLDSVTNIIARFAFEETLKKNSTAFYPYEIKEGDTPEIIAKKFYDHQERHWIVLLFNDIVDPQFDWPLQGRVLNEYIDKKYSANNYADTANTSVSGLSWAKSNIHSYYKTVKQITMEGTTIEQFQVDANTYANVITSFAEHTLNDSSSITIEILKETKSYYDYEDGLNEKKRKIKLIKKEFVPAIEKEFKKVIA
jgi:hypothetical protein